ncbi:MAG TPA: hypothetical protein VJ778_04425 [Burkholderiales bacterium]|nr:hypothetical protein [Burkholderiales bacterium]
MLGSVGDHGNVVNVGRGSRRDVWLTRAGWLWLIYFVSVTGLAISWLLS